MHSNKVIFLFKLGAHQSKVDLIGNKYCSLPSYSETLHANDYPNLFLISLYLSTNANDSRSLSGCTASLGREPQSVMMARVIISKCNMNLAEISGQVVIQEETYYPGAGYYQDGSTFILFCQEQMVLRLTDPKMYTKKIRGRSLFCWHLPTCNSNMYCR